jgi:hypothetical protein
MHTVVAWLANYRVVFIDGNGSVIPVKDEMEFEDACTFVNYLNGGAGKPLPKS